MLENAHLFIGFFSSFLSRILLFDFDALLCNDNLSLIKSRLIFLKRSFDSPDTGSSGRPVITIFSSLLGGKGSSEAISTDLPRGNCLTSVIAESCHPGSLFWFLHKRRAGTRSSSLLRTASTLSQNPTLFAPTNRSVVRFKKNKFLGYRGLSQPRRGFLGFSLVPPLHEKKPWRHKNGSPWLWTMV